MKKLMTLLSAVLFTSTLLLAQTVEEARKSLYHGKTTSAKQAFEKIAAGNQKDAEAIYWLGQTYLAMDSIGGARQVYQNALNGGLNDPLIWVGMGHLELLEGKKDAARQRFDAAITETTKRKKENPVILNAIGRANADGAANIGDPAYAIEKLKRAVELDPENKSEQLEDIYINLGINYLKLGPDQGGNAYEAFNNALRIDPINAKAKFRLGKIFQSQNNVEKYLGYFAGAVEGDPAYTPAYLELYDYYKNRDVNKAGEYLEKYIANSDKDCNADYVYADYLFRSGKYQESLDKAKAMAAGPCATHPRLKVLYAYNYDRLGDSVQARTNIESFIASMTPEQLKGSVNAGSDFLFGASVLKKFPGGEETAIGYLQKALEYDTVRATRFTYMDTIAALYKKQGKLDERLHWLRESYTTNPNPTNLDIYNMADAAINAGKYDIADTMSRLYIQKYPDQEYGYALLVRGAKAADTTGGGSFDEIKEYVDFLTTQDAAKNASKIKTQYYFIASVAADKMKDYPTALDAVNKILAIDPADTFATQAKPVLEKVINQGSATPKKTASTTGGSK